MARDPSVDDRSPGRALDPERIAPEAAPGVRILPVVHERLEMACAARAVLDALDPAAVAVELPPAIAGAVGRALDRLPRVSIVLTEEPGEEALVWTVAPGDPFVEALRWARERDRPTYFVDPDLPYAERHPDPVPDPYALFELGVERYLELLAARAAAAPVAADDRRREDGIAYHLAMARAELDGGCLLALLGAAHARRVTERLAAPQGHPFARVRSATVELRHLERASLTAVLPDPPLAHAAWERLRGGQTPVDPELERVVARKVSVVRLGLRVLTGQGDESEARRRRRLVDHAAARSAAPLAGRPAPDRRRLAEVVWRVGAASHAEQTGEAARRWQRRLFFDYAARLARVQGQLASGLYEWVVAARGVADDNLAWEVCETARAYPWQEGPTEIETASIDGLDLDLGTRKVRFRRRFLRVKRRPVAVPVPERPGLGERGPDDAERWLRAFDSPGICSYPPEDLQIENYGRHLQSRALALLSAERRRVEPFSSGMLDGVDVRETLRNFHTGTLYVREEGRVPAQAGSVVVVFDRDPEGERFPFEMTWLGEHDQESDMAFYSTEPGEQVVGPGILRATYGAFLLTQPRGRLADVWTDPDYRWARERAEVLVMAAIDYSAEATVVHVAPRPPAERLKRYAALQKKRLYHVPLGNLSPETARKIRVVHLLAGRDKREVARDYIW